MFFVFPPNDGFRFRAAGSLNNDFAGCRKIGIRIFPVYGKIYACYLIAVKLGQKCDFSNLCIVAR